jgi:hypothetical protein
MLHLIKDLTDPLVDYLLQDPVRPELSPEFRVAENREAFALKDNDDKVKAVVCVAYNVGVPSSVKDLVEYIDANPDTAVFYTIWSYAAGAGKDLLEEVQDHIKASKANIKNFVTLSPKTEMARRFHHKNGATTYRENEDTINYKYNN